MSGMQYDSIPLNRMSPDSSDYQKGLRRVSGLVPLGDQWREITTPEVAGTTALPADSTTGGCFSDPLGSIFIGTTTGATSRLYEYDPATATFTNRTPAGDYAAPAGRWRFTKFGARVIAVGESTVLPQTRSGAGNFANLITSADRPRPRYIGVSKSYLIGAYNQAGGGGVYATANPYQVMWSSRNNPTIFTPGVDRSGFAPDLANGKGEITGVACFEEFFLVFQQQGVTRFSWVGGDGVWEMQEIAGPAFGLRSEWSDSLVTTERIAYYMSNYGPAAIVNGEQASAIGEGTVRNFFMDEGAATNEVNPLLRTDLISAVYDTWSGVVVQSAGSGPARIITLFSPASDRWSVVELPSFDNISSVAVGYAIQSYYPLDNIVCFQLVGATLQAIRFNSAAGTRTTMPASLSTKRWRPSTGERAALHSLRPLFLLANRAAAPVYPDITVQVLTAAEPRFASFDTFACDTSSLDGNGWATSSIFPLEAGEMTFEISIPSMGDVIISEFPALELAFYPKSVF